MIGKRQAKEGLYLLELQTKHGFNSKNVYSLHYDSNTVKFDTFDVCIKDWVIYPPCEWDCYHSLLLLILIKF